MASFSHYVATCYRSLYASKCRVPGELTLSELQRVLTDLGFCDSVHTKTDAIEYIYRYDSSLTGRLGLDDFLELLSQLQSEFLSLQDHVAESIEYFERRASRSMQLSSDDLREVLRSGVDPLLPAEAEAVLEEVTQQSQLTGNGLAESLFEVVFRSTSWVEDPPRPISFNAPLSQRITIRFLMATNTSAFLRCKPRGTHLLEYASLDPMMTVSCAGAKGETSVLVGQDEPEWAQDVVLTIDVPSRDPAEVLRWLGQQILVVAMYDYQAYGVVPHLEWLASVKKPLVALIAESVDGAPVLHRLTLESLPPHPFPSYAEVAITIPTTLSNLWHSYGGCAEDFFIAHEKKVKRDIGRGLLGKEGEAEEKSQFTDLDESKNTDVLCASAFGWESKTNDGSSAQHAAISDELFDRWREFRSNITQRFPRRHFQLMAKDENGLFTLLTRFVQPLFDCGLDTADSIVHTIARIDCGYLGFEPSREPHKQSISSPSRTLCSQRGTPLELAVLLCCLLLGKGYDAYVCLGHARAQLTPWVITIHDKRGDVVDDGMVGHDSCSSGDEDDARLDADFGVPEKKKSEEDTSIAQMTRMNNNDVDDEEGIFCGPLSACSRSDRTGNETLPSQNNGEVREYHEDARSKSTNASSRRRTINRKKRGSIVAKPSHFLTNVPSVLDGGGGNFVGLARDGRLEDSVWDGFDPSRFVRRFEVDDILEERQLLRVQHWLPASGEHGFTDEHILNTDGSLCGSEARQKNGRRGLLHALQRVGCIFNHKNVWVNVQDSDMLERVRWDIRRPELWEPLIPEQLLRKLCSESCFECVYAEPSWSGAAVAQMHDSEDSRTLLSDLVDAVSTYRLHQLYVPDTKFHRATSIALLRELERAAEAYEIGGVDGLSEHATARFRANVPGEGKHRGKQNGSRVNFASIGNADGNIREAKVPPMVSEVLPDHTVWYEPSSFYDPSAELFTNAVCNSTSQVHGTHRHGRMFHLKTDSVAEIMTTLEATGLLDCTVPYTMYSIAAKVVTGAWGLRFCFVYVGYLIDIDALHACTPSKYHATKPQVVESENGVPSVDSRVRWRM